VATLAYLLLPKKKNLNLSTSSTYKIHAFYIISALRFYSSHFKIIIPYKEKGKKELLVCCSKSIFSSKQINSPRKNKFHLTLYQQQIHNTFKPAIFAWSTAAARSLSEANTTLSCSSSSYYKQIDQFALEKGGNILLTKPLTLPI
jgi:hypothetical protein